MKTSRIVLLGLFAAAGIGLALGVGFSAAPPDDISERAGRATPLNTERAGRATPLNVDDKNHIGRPIVVQPYLSYAQQFLPRINKEHIQQLGAQVQQLLGQSSLPASQGALPPAAGPTADLEPAQNSTPPEPDESVTRTTIDGKEDGLLSIDINDEDIRKVLKLLSVQGDLNILAGKNVTGKVSASLKGVDIESALEAILTSNGYAARRDGKFIYVGTPDDLNSMEQVMDKIGTRIYRPNYVTAAELQALIQPLLSEKVGVMSVSTPAESGIGADDTGAGGDSYAGSEVVVVRDYEAVLAEVDQMVGEVDIRPLQVHIEAMILSVKLKDEDKYGVNFELLRNQPNIKFGWGDPLSTLAKFNFEKGTLKIGFLDGSLGAFLDALESIGDTNVVAAPRLMVINKHRAEVQIGEQKGYVSTTITETSTSESVEFLDIGALLRLRPFISTDGIIRMEIHPELSDGNVEVKGGFTLPNKEVTQVTTNIMVRDGCTVVIGGLMRETLQNTTNQVPLFGNLPLVGFAFRSSTETTERREILILITPHIVYEPNTCEEGEQSACEFFRRQSLYANKMTPFNKRYIAKKYFRLAQAAWAAGNRNTALRFAEMSVHFDPLNRAAIDLRSDIWLGNPVGKHTLGAGDQPPPVASPMDGQSIAPWLLDGLELEAPATTRAPIPMTLHPLDPGQPGGKTDVLRPRRLK